MLPILQISDAEIKLENNIEQIEGLTINQGKINQMLEELNIDTSYQISFNDKRELLKTYIKEIKIYSDDEVDTHFISIVPSLIGMKEIVFVKKWSNNKTCYELVDANQNETIEIKVLFDEIKGKKFDLLILMDGFKRYKRLIC